MNMSSNCRKDGRPLHAGGDEGRDGTGEAVDSRGAVRRPMLDHVQELPGRPLYGTQQIEQPQKYQL